jgi:threonine/homoserine/homoserine lactone efflux protein
MSELLISLVLVAVVTTFTPGPATLLAAAIGARYGFLRCLPVLAGITAGLVALVAAAAVGLAALLQSVPVLQASMKVAGSAYLLWLAWKIGRSGAPDIGTAAASPAGFGSGLVLLWLNPKAWAMALGAASAFAGLASDSLRLAGLLGAVFGIAVAASLSLWCAGGLVLGRRLRTARQWQTVNAALGLLQAASVATLWL